MTAENPAPGNLLLIDPAGSIPEAAVAVISGQGYALHRIGGAPEGIDWTQRPAPRLILLSDHPPMADGPAICRRLRQIPELMAIPVLMLLEGPDRNRIDAAFARGASDYVSGPLPNPELTMRIALLLKSVRPLGPTGDGSGPENEGMLRKVFEEMPLGIALFDDRGTYLDANRSLLRQLGLRKAELEGRTIFEERPETADVPWRADLIRRVVETGEPVEKHARLGDRFFRVYACPIPDRWGRIVRVAAFSNDITELRHLQEQLIHTERMAATGQLAVSVAHEINSPLAALGFAFLSMEKQLAHDEITARRMEVLKGSLAAIRRTVNNLLDLSRPAKAETQPTDLNDLIRRTVELNRSFLKKNRIDANLHLFDPPPVIQASPQELSQVFINLIKNATESIAVSPAASGAIQIRTRPCEHGVEIHIEDDGPGIPEEDLRGIFDPFYTRRKPLGMGIGLSVCLKIIESLSGTMQVSNRPEGGARFVIHIPLRPPAEPPSDDTQGGLS